MNKIRSSKPEAQFDDPILAGLLASTPPNLTEDAASRFLAEHYGIVAQVSEVACERDQNFHVRTPDDQEFVLKISNPVESRLTTDFQTQGILWIEREDPTLPVPKLVPTRTGEVETQLCLPDGRECRVRVLTWLPGLSLHKVPLTPEIDEALGTVLARLGIALKGFQHPGAQQELLWDIRHIPRLRPMLSVLPHDDISSAVRSELDQIEARTLPRLPALRHQVVHNDLNHHNVMVDPENHAKISGVIDFGDMVETCLAVDVAVAASYLADRPGDALGAVSRMVSAYHKVTPLLREEVEVLRDLIVARLITSITITGWRANQYPKNAAYILRNNGPARQAMVGFRRLEPDLVTEALLRACELE